MLHWTFDTHGHCETCYLSRSNAALNVRYPRTLWNMLPMSHQCFTQRSVPTEAVKHVTYVAAMLHWTFDTHGHCKTCYLCRINASLNVPYPRTLWNMLLNATATLHSTIDTHGHCETRYLSHSNASLNVRYPRTLWNTLPMPQQCFTERSIPTDTVKHVN